MFFVGAWVVPLLTITISYTKIVVTARCHLSGCKTENICNTRFNNGTCNTVDSNVHQPYRYQEKLENTNTPSSFKRQNSDPIYVTSGGLRKHFYCPATSGRRGGIPTDTSSSSFAKHTPAPAVRRRLDCIQTTEISTNLKRMPRETSYLPSTSHRGYADDERTTADPGYSGYLRRCGKGPAYDRRQKKTASEVGSL